MALPHKNEPKQALRVLVVEDNSIIGQLLTGMLEEMDYDVCSVESTEADAVAAASHYQPNLMIVDARLADGSGISAVETILRGRFVSHLFISGNTAKVRAIRPEAVVLQKPFGEAELSRAIQQALNFTTVS